MNRITEAHIFVWRATTAIQCALRLFDSFTSETTKINYQFLNEKYYLQYLLEINFMVSDLISSVRHCLKSLSFNVVRKLQFIVIQLNILPKLNSASHSDANGIKSVYNTKKTDKHDAEYTRNACLGIN